MIIIITDMKLPNLPVSSARWASGLSFCLLASSVVAFGQQAPYQIQGNYNPGMVSQPRPTTLLPQSYQQQGVPPAGAGLQRTYVPAQPARTYVPAQPTASAPRQAELIYVPATPSTLPTAYAQQGVYAQPQPYPAAVQQPVVHSVHPQLASSPPTQTISAKDREQDRRLTALEKRKTSTPYVPATPSGQYARHVVRKNESLWGIAERYGVSESSIKAANRRSSDMVIEGETLLIPGTSQAVPSGLQATSGTHIVRQGESLSKIAAAYGISASALQKANGISNPNLIQQGQQLTIPSGRASISRPVVYSKPKTKTRNTSTPPSKSKQTVVYSDVPSAAQGLGSVSHVSGPRGVTSYRVETGDKIENVARTFNSTPSEIQRINKLSSPQLPAPGEEIIVPLPGSVAM